MNKKRGQSQIISTVLLILISIIAASLIIAAVIPFVKDKLSEGDCLDVLGKITISNKYTCYNESALENITLVQIHIDDIRDLINGFAIELGGSSSKSVKIVEGNPENIKMYGEGDFEIPNSTEERTYNISVISKPDRIAVYPILTNNKLCSESDSITEVDYCANGI